MICPTHNIQYNPETNKDCAICLMHPDIQVKEMKRIERLAQHDIIVEKRMERRMEYNIRHNLKMKEKRKLLRLIKQNGLDKKAEV